MDQLPTQSGFETFCLQPWILLSNNACWVPTVPKEVLPTTYTTGTAQQVPVPYIILKKNIRTYLECEEAWHGQLAPKYAGFHWSGLLHRKKDGKWNFKRRGDKHMSCCTRTRKKIKDKILVKPESIIFVEICSKSMLYHVLLSKNLVVAGSFNDKRHIYPGLFKRTCTFTPCAINSYT